MHFMFGRNIWLAYLLPTYRARAHTQVPGVGEEGSEPVGKHVGQQLAREDGCKKMNSRYSGTRFHFSSYYNT